MKTLTFQNSDTMPALGLGTWKSEQGEVYAAVKTAIKQGYRHIDCAPIYGNEKEIGQAVTDCIAEDIVSRDQLWVTSKLWNDAHAKTDVVPALKQTLNDLQLAYLDLYLIHWPVALQKGVFFAQSASDMVSLTDVPISETWQGMEESVSLGLAKHIGVSNFGVKTLQNLLSNCKIQPEMNQVECHPFLQQGVLLSFCKANNIHLTAYSPLGSFDRPEVLKAANEPRLLDDIVISEIAKKHNASTAQVLISWALHRDTSVIPKSVNPSRIAENLEAEQLQLSADEIKAMAALERDYRYVNGKFWVLEGGPYTLEALWA